MALSPGVWRGFKQESVVLVATLSIYARGGLSKVCPHENLSFLWLCGELMLSHQLFYLDTASGQCWGKKLEVIGKLLPEVKIPDILAKAYAYYINFLLPPSSSPSFLLRLLPPFLLLEISVTYARSWNVQEWGSGPANTVRAFQAQEAVDHQEPMWKDQAPSIWKFDCSKRWNLTCPFSNWSKHKINFQPKNIKRCVAVGDPGASWMHTHRQKTLASVWSYTVLPAWKHRKQFHTCTNTHVPTSNSYLHVCIYFYQAPCSIVCIPFWGHPSTALAVCAAYLQTLGHIPPWSPRPTVTKKYKCVASDIVLKSSTPKQC